MSHRGRVVAKDGDALKIRTASGDIVASGTARPGDLVEVTDAGAVHLVRAFPGRDYPAPGHEVWRLSPTRARGIAARARVLKAVRGFFAERDFLEVETPILVPTPGLEIHLRAVPAADGHLITSPEYQLKRLLTAGMERIFTVCKCFRDGEQGAQHNREFTMLEWYRAWADIADIAADTEALVVHVVTQLTGSARLPKMDLSPPWPRVTVAEAMAEHAGVCVRGDESTAELAEKLAAAGIDTGTAATWDDLFAAAFVARVEPALARMTRPLFLTEWPIRLAALARAKPDNPAVAERIEAYVGGIELANGFGELCDPDIQRARLESDQRERERRGLEVYAIDEKFLAALDEGMPPSAGIALGIDRLVMLASGITNIADTLTFTTAEL